MRRHIFILSIALALGLVACDKTEVVTTAEGEGVISFAPQTVKTRALINSATDLRDYTLKIWDIWSGQTTPYIDNTLVYSEDWQYGDTSDAPYFWKAGTHKFFSYIDGIGTLGSDNKLTVSKSLTATENVDMLYSDILATTASAWMADSEHTPTTPVPLHFNHLLSAISIMVKNCCTDTPVTLNSVSTVIPNNGSATVDFSGTTVQVTYSETVTADTSTPFISGTAISDLSLESGALADVIAQAAATENAYYVIWPQEIEEDAIVVNVNYSINGTSYTKPVSLPASTWAAGNKYTYTLCIYPTDVRLKFVVQPWDKIESDVDTKNGSINMSNVTWMNTVVKLTQDGEDVNTVDDSAFSVYMFYHPYVNGVQYTANNGYYPAQAYFTVNYPQSGLFKIGLIPAFGQSQMDESAFEIVIYDDSITSGSKWRAQNADGETITNNTVYFQVRAAKSSYSSLTKAQVDIWFKPTGSDEWISAYSEVRANYAATINPSN